LWKQIFRYGATRVQKETLAELCAHPKFFVPSIFTVYLASVPAVGWMSAFAFLPLAAYGLLALAFGSLRAAACRRAEYVLLLPPVFLWIHVAYGAGFLSHLLKGKWARPANVFNS
jgi:hypothetical protein